MQNRGTDEVKSFKKSDSEKSKIPKYSFASLIELRIVSSLNLTPVDIKESYPIYLKIRSKSSRFNPECLSRVFVGFVL